MTRDGHDYGMRWVLSPEDTATVIVRGAEKSKTVCWTDCSK